MLTPTYHLFTFLLFVIALTASTNAFTVQEDKSMRFIYLMFAFLLCVLGVLRVVATFGLIDITTGVLLEVTRGLWIMALGGLISILGVPIGQRLLTIRHDNKT